eukprot:gene6984-7769_t
MSGKQRRYRRRRRSDNEEEEHQEAESVSEKLEELKEIQKFRIRPKGVNAAGLAFGQKIDEKIDPVVDDPFKIKSGGLIDMNYVKDRNRDRSDEAIDKDVTNLGSNFSLETNRRDEDVEMLRFIENEVARRKGQDKDEKQQYEKPKTKEDLLYQVPDYLNVPSKVMKSEEMLSNQMLSGIPEVPLGIEAKIKNIEATEEAKMKFLNESKNKNKTTSDFVPTNLASNFLHHDRFFNEKKALEKEKQKEKVRKEEELLSERERSKGPVIGPEIIDFDSAASNTDSDKRKRKPDKDEASDDYLYEKFRKKTMDSWRYQ